MIEIGLVIAACVGMSKIADADGRSAAIWGVITLIICLVSLAIPLPFLRVLLGFVIAFIALMIAKSRDRR